MSNKSRLARLEATLWPPEPQGIHLLPIPWNSSETHKERALREYCQQNPGAKGLFIFDLQYGEPK